jgi:hypothetical protein
LEVYIMAVAMELRKIDLSGMPGTVSAPPRTTSALGICVTCNYVDTCTGRASWLGPVFHCEEFDDRVEMVQAEVPMGAGAEATAARIESTVQLGLCENCEHRTGCGFRRQEGGVWHCEEYE